MLVAIRQRVRGWFGGSERSNAFVRADDFRLSEPVFTDTQRMEDVGNANVQIGSNNTGAVRVVNLKQERNVTNIFVYGEQGGPPPSTAKPSLTTPEQREVLALIRRLRKSDSVFAFMTKNFGTKMVMDLQPSQVLRVKLYIESINNRISKAGRESA